MVPHVADPHPDAPGTRATFEQTWQAINRTKRAKTATFGGVFLLAVAGSLWVSEVSISQFVEGLPGLIGLHSGDPADYPCRSHRYRYRRVVLGDRSVVEIAA